MYRDQPREQDMKMKNRNLEGSRSAAVGFIENCLHKPGSGGSRHSPNLGNEELKNKLLLFSAVEHSKFQKLNEL